ncbi:low molecular weight protein-tyrosine-phosphatase [Roseiflexus sp.]|uniref:low molecular weight protein-tyrosine-phosphatase n=1 Tax=Roseiflexus sp. TaxID=2562120 RepID=UPI00398B0276
MGGVNARIIRVLFVCTGNICRSPMAEGIFRHYVEQAGLSGRIKTDSAGTGAWNVGDPPHPGVTALFAERGIRYSHRARVVHAEDFTRFDYIVAAERAHLDTLRRMPGSSLVRLSLLLDYAPDIGLRDVPDPYYNGRFRDVYDMIDRACRGLLEHIIRVERLVLDP